MPLRGCSLQLVTRWATVNNVRILSLYYAGTALFLLLDYVLGINVRIAFLDPWPLARLGYYAFCFACLVLIVWRPAWAAAVGTVESLITLVALILGMGLRILVPNDAIFEEMAPIVTIEELVNFMIVGFAAYFAWVRGLKALNFH